jgi:hypothetical protein
MGAYSTRPDRTRSWSEAGVVSNAFFFIVKGKDNKLNEKTQRKTNKKPKPKQN